MIRRAPGPVAATAPAEAAQAVVAGEALRGVSWFAVAWLLLLLAAKAGEGVGGGPAQVPFLLALFVLPLLYAFPWTHPMLARHRWPVLGVQTVLTWVPLVVFGSNWAPGVDGLLAGLLLLMVAAPLSWLLAGMLLVAEFVVRAAVTGLPWPGTPTWFSAVTVPVYFLDDCLPLFGLVWLAGLVNRVSSARGELADLAVARERLQAAEDLQAAVGWRLVAVAAKAAEALEVLPSAPDRARAQLTQAGAAAREAAGRVREVITDRRTQTGLPSAATPVTERVVGARLALLVLVVVLFGFAIESLDSVSTLGYSPRLAALAVADIVLITVLQLHHSWSARAGGRPRAWPLTLAAQAALAYAFVLPFARAYLGGLGPFLAGSVLLLVPGRWRWAGYAAVVCTWPVLVVTMLSASEGGLLTSQRVTGGIYYVAITAAIGLMVFGLSRLAGTARQVETLGAGLAGMAVVTERLRVARDVHDLLGLGLSAVALKADLAGQLIGADDTRAAAEIEQMKRICATAQADIRLVTGGGQRLSLAAELATAEQILSSVGVRVQASIPDVLLAPTTNDVLAPVLREAVTNILRHSVATACRIELAAEEGMLRLAVSNDGATGHNNGDQGARLAAAGGAAGSGLGNLTARVQVAGGQLTSRQTGDRFELTVQIPLGVPASAGPATEPSLSRNPATPARRAASRWPGAFRPVRISTRQPGSRPASSAAAVSPSVPGRPMYLRADSHYPGRADCTWQLPAVPTAAGRCPACPATATASPPQWPRGPRPPGCARRAW
jgi:two-component system sensor histidine kinase DesK